METEGTPLTGTPAPEGTPLAGTPTIGTPSAAATPAVDYTHDLAIFNDLLKLEFLSYALYQQVLDKFDDAAFRAKRPASVRPLLERIRDQEKQHIDGLTGLISALKGSPVKAQTYDFGYGDDVDAFFPVAAKVETTVVGAYVDAATRLQDPALLTVLLGLHGTEARHAAYLNQRLAESPFPTAIDAALGAADVEQDLSAYIKP